MEDLEGKISKEYRVPQNKKKYTIEYYVKPLISLYKNVG